MDVIEWVTQFNWLAKVLAIFIVAKQTNKITFFFLRRRRRCRPHRMIV